MKRLEPPNRSRMAIGNRNAVGNGACSQAIRLVHLCCSESFESLKYLAARIAS